MVVLLVGSVNAGWCYIAGSGAATNIKVVPINLLVVLVLLKVILLKVVLLMMSLVLV